jgi:hypothetical protein
MSTIKPLLYILIIITVSLLSACAAGEVNPPELTVSELLSAPDKYNGEVVVVSGFYFHGFETVVLCEGLKSSGLAEGHLVPEGRTMWVEGGLPLDVYDRLQVQSSMGPEERYGEIRIKGKFETGGQYGHLGGYDSRISPLEVELLP